MRSHRVSNRRAHERMVSDRGSVTCQEGIFAWKYELKNISTGGALVSGGPIFDQFAVLEVTLALPHAPRITLDAYVVREEGDSQEPRIALAFLNGHEDVEDALAGCAEEEVTADLAC